MDSSNPTDTGPDHSLIIRPSSGLLGLPEGRSAPLEEMILRSLDHLSESTGLVALEPRPGEEREFQIAPGVTMRMCWCPPGEFIMGSPETEEDHWENEGQVGVVLSKGFWMGKTQVTQAQWQAVMGNNPSRFKGANRPVECVSWHDTQEFLERVNSRMGHSNGARMALATEAQWEYAARAGENGIYAGGNLDEVAWYDRNSRNETHSVGEKKANCWGLHDMTGNVWEWCQDWYDAKLRGGLDPRGPDSGMHRVFRGGSWNSSAYQCPVAIRYGTSQTDSEESGGFRVVRSFSP